MGLSTVVPVRGVPPLATLLEQLVAAGLPSSLMMVDNLLVSSKVPPPSTWRDARLKTAAGTVTLKRDAHGVSVTVFGNADQALLDAQALVAKLVAQI